MTRKISDGVARIKLGLADELRLGDLDPKRDWGFAGDYVRAMWMMLQQEEPADYVVATGEQHTVREFVELASGTQASTGSATSSATSSSCGPQRSFDLVGDASKAQRELGWEPRMSFPELVQLMVDADIDRLSGEPEAVRPPAVVL